MAGRRLIRWQASVQVIDEDHQSVDTPLRHQLLQFGPEGSDVPDRGRRVVLRIAVEFIASLFGQGESCAGGQGPYVQSDRRVHCGGDTGRDHRGRGGEVTPMVRGDRRVTNARNRSSRVGSGHAAGEAVEDGVDERRLDLGVALVLPRVEPGRNDLTITFVESVDLLAYHPEHTRLAGPPVAVDPDSQRQEPSLCERDHYLVDEVSEAQVIVLCLVVSPHPGLRSSALRS